MLAIVIVEAVAIGLLGLLVAGLLRSHAEILRRLHHLGAGLDLGARPVAVAVGGPHSPAGSISGEAPDGDAVSVALDRPGQRTLVLFLSSGCGTCGPWWDGLRAGAHRRAVAGVDVVVVARDATDESPSLLAGLAPSDVPVVLSSRAWDDFGVPGSPYAVLVDGSSGRVMGEGVARSWDQLASLLGQHLEDLGSRGRADAAGRVDAELLAAGIHPGHASLRPPPGSWTREGT